MVDLVEALGLLASGERWGPLQVPSAALVPRSGQVEELSGTQAGFCAVPGLRGAEVRKGMMGHVTAYCGLGSQ